MCLSPDWAQLPRGQARPSPVASPLFLWLLVRKRHRPLRPCSTHTRQTPRAVREFAPAATVVAVVQNPGMPYTALAYKELEQAAKIVNIELRAFEVRSPEEITPQP